MPLTWSRKTCGGRLANKWLLHCCRRGWESAAAQLSGMAGGADEEGLIINDSELLVNITCRFLSKILDFYYYGKRGQCPLWVRVPAHRKIVVTAG